MIIRKSSQGHRIRLHKNTTPGATRTKTYPNGTVETLTYPSRYDYFVEVDGEVVKRSDSWDTIEEHYVDECAKLYDNGHGRLLIGKHQVIGGIATLQSEYPDESNTKAEIKAWYDLRSISYDDSETKAELLSRIVENFNAKHIKK
tara:strand:- start:34 stop:468 length:435 start_codon:yes stop_codon:yes gene_type:complete